MEIDVIARFVERASSEIETAEQALRGEASYLGQVADGLLDESIHPDHLPVVGNRIASVRQQVEAALSQAEQYLYLAH